MILNRDIPITATHMSLWSNEASEVKYLAQGHKHVSANRARTHNLPFMSPACSAVGLYKAEKM